MRPRPARGQSSTSSSRMPDSAASPSLPQRSPAFLVAGLRLFSAAALTIRSPKSRR